LAGGAVCAKPHGEMSDKTASAAGVFIFIPLFWQGNSNLCRALTQPTNSRISMKPGALLYSPDLNKAATLRLGLMLAEMPVREAVVLGDASQEAAAACSKLGAS